MKKRQYITILITNFAKLHFYFFVRNYLTNKILFDNYDFLIWKLINITLNAN